MIFDGQYLTYSEYQALGGALGEMPFNLLELRARKQIDELTQCRLVDLESQVVEVKVCIYQLINRINSYVSTGGVSSESIDGYSVNYNAKLTDEQEKECYNTIREHLVTCKLEDGTPYMYLGVM